MLVRAVISQLTIQNSRALVFFLFWACARAPSGRIDELAPGRGETDLLWGLILVACRRGVDRCSVLLAEIHSTRPLCVTRAEEVESIREWAGLELYGRID